MTNKPNRPGTDAARHGTGDADLAVMVAAHDAFRRDLRKLATAAAQARTWEPQRQAAVYAGWEVFKRQLHVHHGGEDAVVWPLLRERTAGSGSAASLLDAMQAEHERIDPILDAVDWAFGFAEAHDSHAMADASDAIDDLATQLSDHLDHEEKDALPLIGQTLSATEWSAVGRNIGRKADVGISFVPEFFGWLLDGAATDKRVAVLAALPAAMRPLIARVFVPLYGRRQDW